MFSSPTYADPNGERHYQCLPTRGFPHVTIASADEEEVQDLADRWYGGWEGYVDEYDDWHTTNTYAATKIFWPHMTARLRFTAVGKGRGHKAPFRGATLTLHWGARQIRVGYDFQTPASFKSVGAVHAWADELLSNRGDYDEFLRTFYSPAWAECVYTAEGIPFCSTFGSLTLGELPGGNVVVVRSLQAMANLRRGGFGVSYSTQRTPFPGGYSGSSGPSTIVEQARYPRWTELSPAHLAMWTYHGWQRRMVHLDPYAGLDWPDTCPTREPHG